MIKTRQDLRRFLNVESKTYSRIIYTSTNLLSALKANLFSEPISDQKYIWKYIKTLRRLEFYVNKKHRSIFLLQLVYLSHRLRRLGRITGFQIPTNTIDCGLTIYHYGMIIINGKTTIGRNLVLRPDIVIGHKEVGGKCPRIGDDVTINSGVRIIGDVTIGDDVVIAPNTIVVKDIPSHSMVAGIPSRVIKTRKSRNEQWQRC